MPRTSTHRYTFTLSDEAEDGTVLHEAECRITYTFHPSRAATAPSYASGGDPPEPAMVEWTELDSEQIGPEGRLVYATAPSEIADRMLNWIEANDAELIRNAEIEREGRSCR